MILQIVMLSLERDNVRGFNTLKPSIRGGGGTVGSGMAEISSGLARLNSQFLVVQNSIAIELKQIVILTLLCLFKRTRPN